MDDAMYWLVILTVTALVGALIGRLIGAAIDMWREHQAGQG